MKNVSRAMVEKKADVKLIHGWILDGVGPARWGWAVLEPCKQRWVGKTLAAVAVSLRVTP